MRSAMIRGLARRFEEAHGVVIRDEAVRGAVMLSSRYITGRQLPDKAVDLLDTAAARAKILRASTPSSLEDIRARLASLDRQIDALERDDAAGHSVEEGARAHALAERDTLRNDAKAIGRRTSHRSERSSRRSTSFAPRRLRVRSSSACSTSCGRSRTKRGSSTPTSMRILVAAIVGDWTGIPVGQHGQDDVRAIVNLEPKLRGRVRGQDGALEVIGRELRAARSGLKPVGPPLGVFLLVGPSGVGKTETALGLADLLFGGERFLVTINMSEFQERHTVSRLIGSPPAMWASARGGS